MVQAVMPNPPKQSQSPLITPITSFKLLVWIEMKGKPMNRIIVTVLCVLVLASCVWSSEPADENKTKEAPASPEFKLKAEVLVLEDTYLLSDLAKAPKGPGVNPRTVPRIMAAAVKLELVITNQSDETLTFTFGNRWPALSLKGPGVETVAWKGTYKAKHVPPLKVTLEPGKKYVKPIVKLVCGMHGMDYIRWTKPGDYTLSVSVGTSEQCQQAPPVTLHVKK